TPFTDSGEIDFPALDRLVDYVITDQPGQGVEYLVIHGSTGEAATTTADEKAAILRAVVARVGGRVPVVVGVGGNDTRAVLTQLAATDYTGIAAVLSVSPAYNKPSQAGIVAHYSAVADASPVPVILYNVPGRTGSNLTAATTLALARHSNIIGTKEASGNMGQCLAILAGAPDGFALVSGEDTLTPALIAHGALGAISVLANAVPRTFSAMTRAALAGNFRDAARRVFSFLPLDPLLYEEANPVGIKAALAARGVCGPMARLPLLPATDDLTARIGAALPTDQ
ncbi:MAG: 4-hydroxy-tetrahydrodipicolinate synthase, partial [Hymenobacteraceae bacterium]|nr:4-hydroxy-tetrahydrodipicolinate synthase [Hymenobacteraceae bacterium]